MKRFWILGLAAVVVAGCSGGETPTNGDNPASSNAVSSDSSPRAADRGAPSSTRGESRRTPQAPPPGMKGM